MGVIRNAFCVLLLFAAACGSDLQPCPEMRGPPQVIEAACMWVPACWHDARARWASLGFPLEGCEAFPNVTWVGIDDIDFACDSDFAAGCHRAGVIHVFRGGSERDRQELLFHELMHALGWCSAIGSDPNHLDQRRWTSWM